MGNQKTAVGPRFKTRAEGKPAMVSSPEGIHDRSKGGNEVIVDEGS